MSRDHKITETLPQGPSGPMVCGTCGLPVGTMAFRSKRGQTWSGDEDGIRVVDFVRHYPDRRIAKAYDRAAAALAAAPPALDAAPMNRQTAYDALPRDADDSMYELADKIFDALSLAATPASGEPDR